MAAKDVKFDTDARNRMLRGVNVLANAVKAGDRILFGKWSGTEVTLDGTEYLIMKESDILGIIDSSAASAKAA